jgi:N-acetylglucosamine kinase-like BadF-type ATPase
MNGPIYENDYRVGVRCQCVGGIEVITMLIGVDAGGTSTRAVALDPAGRCLGVGTAGGGNPVSRGPESAAAAVRDAILGALPGGAVALTEGSSGPVGPADATGPANATGPAHGSDVMAGPTIRAEVVLAMAGARAFFDRERVVNHLAEVGLDASITVEPDLLATFCSGSPEPDGYALVAGTGAAAVRVQDGRVSATADGLGWLLGDGGSGFWIGHRVVRAAAAALDGRGPETRLSAMLLDEVGTAGPEMHNADGRAAALQYLVDRLYQDRPVELSRFAALALRAADDGDPVALSILAGARERLAQTLRAVHRPEVAGPIVVGGGIARRLPDLDRVLQAAIGGPAVSDVAHVADMSDVADVSHTPGPVVAVPDGTVGAAVLALRRGGIAVDRAVFDRLTASVDEARQHTN